MMARKRGKVVNIASLTTAIGLSKVTVYTSSKGALGQLTKGLAVEWGPYNIQVNAIAPGFILTDLNRKLWEIRGAAQLGYWPDASRPPRLSRGHRRHGHLPGLRGLQFRLGTDPLRRWRHHSGESLAPVKELGRDSFGHLGLESPDSRQVTRQRGPALRSTTKAACYNERGDEL
jgi:NAD(P)-dependent dehydrogenase (short-subunit alcohol dehydrogenase family)